MPFKWGRRRDEWTLDDAGASLKIAKATLELAGPTVALEIESEKHGLRLRLEIARTGTLVTTTRLPDGYAVDVVMPAPAEGRLWVNGMDAPRPVRGTGAVTHTWMERPEGELLHRRVESFMREGDVALYLSDLRLADGGRRSLAVASRAGHVLDRADDVTLDSGSHDDRRRRSRLPGHDQVGSAERRHHGARGRSAANCCA